MSDPTSLPAFPEPEPEPGTGPGLGAGFDPEPYPPDADDLREEVVEALQDTGYDPEVDEDGDVAVRVDEQLLFVRCVDTEPPMMRVFGQWLLDGDAAEDELTRLRAANAVTGALNLVKVTVHEDRLVVAIDLVVSDGIDLTALLPAALDAVLGSVRTWHETALQLEQDAHDLESLDHGFDPATFGELGLGADGSAARVAPEGSPPEDPFPAGSWAEGTGEVEEPSWPADPRHRAGGGEERPG